MNYLREVANEIRAMVPSNDLPEGDDHLLFDLYAVLALSAGTTVRPEDVHNAWVVWMASRDPSHGSLRPYRELDQETRAADRPFVDAIRAWSSENVND